MKLTTLLSILLFVGLSVLVSCKKENNNSNSHEQPVITLQSTVIGKWVVRPLSGRQQGNQVSLKIQDAADLLSIEFLSDSTYIIADADGDVVTGKYNATDGSTINLGGTGILSEIKIAGEKIDFKLFYNGNSISITANKAAEIPLTDSTKLLCRTWHLTTQASGASIYEESGGATDITILFSSAGTYLVQYFKQDSILSAEIANWKWHPALSHAFVYWWYDENEDDDDYVTITELKSNSLKIEEENDGDTTSSIKYVLVPQGYSPRIANPSLKNITNRSSNTDKDKQKAGMFRRKH